METAFVALLLYYPIKQNLNFRSRYEWGTKFIADKRGGARL